MGAQSTKNNKDSSEIIQDLDETWSNPPLLKMFHSTPMNKCIMNYFKSFQL